MTIDEYVAAVLRQLPGPLVDSTRVESDLRAHVADRVEAGATQADAVEHLGTPEEVAAELLATVHLDAASLWQRAGAFVIDVAVGVVALFLAATFVFVPFMDIWDVADVVARGMFFTTFAVGVLLAVAVLALAIVYFPVLEKLFGQTVGKRLLGIVVVRENGSTLRWRDAFIRRIPFFFEFFWLDALFALFTARRQRAFDLVAGTLVVRAQRTAPDTAPRPVMV